MNSKYGTSVELSEIDFFEIERQAQRYRAQVLARGFRAFGAWLGRSFAIGGVRGKTA